MLKFSAKHTLFCKSCDSLFSEKNKPCILNCGNTVCQNCVNKYTKVVFDEVNISCHFEKSHHHIFEEVPINFSYLDLIIDLTKNLVIKYSLNQEEIESFLRPIKSKEITHECSYFKHIDSRAKDKLITGQGKIKTDKIEYSGELKQGWMHGKGKYICKEFTYDGNFVENVPNGKGELILYDEDGQNKKLLVNGEFLGKFHTGFAEIKYQDWSVYVGYYKDFKKNGAGILTFSNGDYYEGDFVNDIKDGEGIYYYYEERKKYVGIWKDDFMEGEFFVYFNDCPVAVKVIFHRGKFDKLVKN